MAVPVIESESVLYGSTGTTTMNVTVPTGAAVGDLIVILCHSDSVDPTAGFACTGFTLAITAGNDLIDAHVGVLWKPYESGDGATYVVTQSFADDFQVRALRISGADLTTPINDVNSGGFTSASNYIYSASSVTSTVADCLWLGVFSYDGGDTPSLPAWSSSETVTEIHSARTGTGSTNLTSWAGVYDQPTAGGSTQVTITWGALADGCVGANLFIAPVTGPSFSADGVSGANISTVSGVPAASISTRDGAAA